MPDRIQIRIRTAGYEAVLLFQSLPLGALISEVVSVLTRGIQRSILGNEIDAKGCRLADSQTCGVVGWRNACPSHMSR
jgi:hypothetical protein